MHFQWPLDRRRSLPFATVFVAVLTLLVLYLLGTVLFTLGLSVVLAYMLLPVVRLIERGMPWRRNRPGPSHDLSIAVIYVLIIAGIAGVLIVLEFNRRQKSVPTTVQWQRTVVADLRQRQRSSHT